MAKLVSVQQGFGHKLYFKAYVKNNSNLSSNYYTSKEKEISWGDDVNLIWSRENNECFYRPSINGKIRFTGVLAALAMEYLSKDSYIELRLYESFSPYADGYNQDWNFDRTSYIEFRISKVDCKAISVVSKSWSYTYNGTTFNFLSSYDIEVTTHLWDRYTNILDNLDKEYDLVKLKIPSVKASYLKRPCLQLYTGGSGYLGHYIGGNYWETEVGDPDSVLDQDNFFTRIARFMSITLKYAPNTSANGSYTADFSDAQNDFPTQPAQGTNGRWEYWLEQNSTVVPLYRIHIRSDSVGGQIFTAIELERRDSQMGSWYSYGTLLRGSDAYGYDLFDPWGNGSNNQFLTSSISGVTLYYSNDVYYGRWYLPSNNFLSGRQVRQKSSNDPTASTELRTYEYLGQAAKEDVQISYGFSDATPDEWGRDDDGNYFHPIGLVPGVYAPLLRSSWVYVPMWLDKTTASANAIDNAFGVVTTIRDAYNIKTVLSYLFSVARYGNINNPFTISIPSSPANLDPSDPYGLNTTSYNLMMIPKSNVVRGEYSLAAQKAPVTLNQILDYLKQFGGIYWRLTSNTTVKFETKEKLPNNSNWCGIQPSDDYHGLSFNTRNGRPLDYGQESIEWDNADIPERISYRWMDACTPVFNGAVELNQGRSVKMDESEEVTSPIFTPDVDFMVISPSECSLDGFALVQNTTSGAPVKASLTFLGNEYIVNNPCCTVAFMQRTTTISSITTSKPGRLTYNRPTTNYKFQYDPYNNTYTANTLRRTAKQQIKLPFPLIEPDEQTSHFIIDDTGWYSKVPTRFGNGYFKSATVNLRSRVATLELELEV